MEDGPVGESRPQGNEGESGREFRWLPAGGFTSERRPQRRLKAFSKSYGDFVREIDYLIRHETNSLLPLAKKMFDEMENSERIVVDGVHLKKIGDLKFIFGYLIEPAFRRDLSLFIYSEDKLNVLDTHPEGFIDLDMGFEWTLERFHYLKSMFLLQDLSPGQPPMTPIERPLFDRLRELGLMPVAQHPIGPYVADFAFPEERIVIECDGRGYHDAERDKRRDAHLRYLGWETHRFTGSEIWSDVNEVAEKVTEIVKEETDRLALLPTTSDSAPKDDLGLLKRLINFIIDLFKHETKEVAEFIYKEEFQETPKWQKELDDAQLEAVRMPDGVGQILAPAGSGKTRVLTARVQELVSRGVSANRILCVAFNKDARVELEGRLGAVGLPIENANSKSNGVACLTFHALGLKIISEAGLLPSDAWRDRKIRSMTYSQLRRLATLAMRNVDDGVFIDAPDAQEAISQFKLGLRLTVQEVREQAGANAWKQTAAEIYRLYEEQNSRDEAIDFDDMILKAINLLRDDFEKRVLWQKRWHHILVDEYQDIDPSQEILVKTIAAPQDNLLVVGDEDQCIYTWRRADVRKITDFHLTYPGLTRTQIKTNYRCHPEIVKAAACLIKKNDYRFAKEILPGLDTEGSAIELFSSVSSETMGEEVANHVRSLVDAGTTRSGDVVVVARTKELLRQTALALSKEGVGFDAPQEIYDMRGLQPERTVLANLRLLSNPEGATVEDILEVFKIPNRYLDEPTAEAIKNGLLRGHSFLDSVNRTNGEGFQIEAQRKGADFLDMLQNEVVEGAKVDEIVGALRTTGGLDRHFLNAEQMSPQNPDQVDSLERLEKEGKDRGLKEFVLEQAQTAEMVMDARDKDGVRLRTIHATKGQEWKHVVLVGCDEEVLPHRTALMERNSDNPWLETPLPGAMVEEERRLCYVAFTRAKERLDIFYDSTNPSRFINEAGLKLEHN